MYIYICIYILLIYIYIYIGVWRQGDYCRLLHSRVYPRPQARKDSGGRGLEQVQYHCPPQSRNLQAKLLSSSFALSLFHSLTHSLFLFLSLLYIYIISSLSYTYILYYAYVYMRVLIYIYVSLYDTHICNIYMYTYVCIENILCVCIYI